MLHYFHRVVRRPYRLRRSAWKFGWRAFQQGLVGFTLLCALLVIPFGVLLEAAPARLVILHSSEHHGALVPLTGNGEAVGGMARRATVISQVRREGTPVLLVDSGDILIGTALSSWFRGEPDIKAMNLMGYHAMATGNHDFDYGLAHLRKLQALADFPILCTNLRIEMGTLPCRRSAVVQVGPVSVGLLGLVGRSNFPDTFNRDVVKVLALDDPVESARVHARRLKNDQRVDLVVAITHQDTAEDLVLLKAETGVDVIVGGHTQGFDGLYVPDARVPVHAVRQPMRVYVKTHRQGRTLGRLDVLIDEGRIVEARAQNLPVTAAVPKEPTVKRLVERYVRAFAAEASAVVGRTEVDLQGDRSHIRTRETNFGDLLADLLRAEYGADVALINGGQIRGSLAAGAITLGDVLSVLPFDSSLVTLQLSGMHLREALENSVSQLPRQSGRFLQVSGLQVVYDLTAEPGHRVRSVKVHGEPLRPDAVYTVVTDAFLAEGGDGYTVFQHVHRRIDHQTPLRDVFLRALAKGPVKGETDRRIRFVAGSSPFGSPPHP